MLELPIPKNDPITAGEIIEEEFRKPLGLTQVELAKALGISRVRYTEIANGKRGVTIDTAFRLARVFDTSPQLWLNIQLVYDIWHMEHSAHAAEIRKLRRLKMKPPKARRAKA
jgi:addiction module HigA family antidote